VPTPDDLFITGQPAVAGRGKQLRVRIGEALFRRWPLFIIPVLLLVGLGVFQAKGLKKHYASGGSINVASSTALSTINDLNSPNFGFDTPAAKTARDVNQRLSSESFTESVAERAGLKDFVTSGAITLDQVRSSLSASTSGDNVLHITARTDFPDLSQKLASSLISTYISYVLDNETKQYTDAAAFVESTLKSYQAAADTAQSNLDAYVKQHPSPAAGSRPDEQVLDIQRLNTAITNAQQQVLDAQSKLDTAQLAVKQAQADITQRLEVVDEPKVPTAPEPIMKKRITTIGIYLVLGLVVAGAGVVLIATLDRSVRTASDIESLPGGLRVVATVPKQRASRKSSSRVVPELTVERTTK
jgi:uncharacterized protein involved in exopolysaccharide biosynthesis